jgi:LPXTG-motif cell wall-anchored protein
VTTSSEVAPIIVTTTNPTAILYDKNYTTPSGVDGDPIKYLTNPEQDTYAAYGDTVGFTIKYVAVNSYTVEAEEEDGEDTEKAVMEYVITDVPTNLDIDLNSLVVKVGDEILTTDEVTNPDTYSTTPLYGYKVSKDAATKIVTITIQWAYELNQLNNSAVEFKYEDGVIVEITYEAEVTSEDKGYKGAKNNATISYDGKEGTVDGGTAIETSKLELQKVDMYGNQLEGAEFKLRYPSVNPFTGVYETKDGELVYEETPLVAETDDEGNIVAYHVYNSADLNKGNTYSYTFTAGNVTIYGLDLDLDYELVETKAPTGYNLLETPVTVEKTKDDDGKVTGFAPLTVENSNGSSLPQTGGMGTTIFYAVGGILVVAALVILITRKRVRRMEE